MTTFDILTALRLADEETAKRLAVYHDTILELNHHINLTGIKDPDESLSKNVYDSLSAYEDEYFPEGGRFLDLGTGAGFPGALLAILRPDMQAVLMDAVQKKLTCVEKALAAAGAKNAKCIHMRAEDGGRRRKLRESFDVVIARAVKSLPVICEWALPFVSVGGTFIDMKGPAPKTNLPAPKKSSPSWRRRSQKRKPSPSPPARRASYSISQNMPRRPRPSPEKSASPKNLRLYKEISTHKNA